MGAALVGLGVLAVAVIGWTWQRGDGSVRDGSREVVPPEVLGLGAADFGATATLLLLAVRDDGKAVPVRSALHDLAARLDGVRVAEVDLTARGDLAGRYAVTRSPSVFVLDGERRLRVRVKGAAGAPVLRAALAQVDPRAD